MNVNQGLVKMLGCDSKDEILPADLTREIIRDPFKRQQLLGNLGPDSPTDALEVVWKRKDGSALKARLRGREVIGTNGRLRGYAIVAEDITKQREQERNLREQAEKDCSTGLDNDQSLMAALDCEKKDQAQPERVFPAALRPGQSKESQRTLRSGGGKQGALQTRRRVVHRSSAHRHGCASRWR